MHGVWGRELHGQSPDYKLSPCLGSCPTRLVPKVLVGQPSGDGGNKSLLEDLAPDEG